MTFPLVASFPLKGSPFYSRISDQLSSDSIKNYYAIAFNPGYPLQASELNELQELFFINTTLSNRFTSIWSTQDKVNPYWNGLIPLDSTYISLTNVTNTTGSWTGTVTISQGWYLWNNPTSNLGFWIYLDNTIIETFNIPVNSTRYFGFTVLDQIISCCSSNTCSDTEDAEIRDNSAGFIGGYLTCGASRLKATINTEVDIRNSIPTIADPDGSFWSLLFRIQTTGDDIVAEYTDNTISFSLVPTTYSNT